MNLFVEIGTEVLSFRTSHTQSITSSDARHHSKFALISFEDSAINKISSSKSIHDGTGASMSWVIKHKTIIKSKGIL